MRKLIVLTSLALAACSGSSPASSGSTATSGGATTSSGSGSTSGTTASSSTSGSSGSSSTGGSGTSGSSSTSGSSGTTCTPPVHPADAPRMVVISKPFRADGGPNTTFEVLKLDATGAMSATGVQFDMHGASQGHIVFTPDGHTGYVAQDDGTIGIFHVEDDAGVTVVDPGLNPGFYARQLIIPAGGYSIDAIDEDTLANGGGLYAMEIGCGGTLVGQTVKLGQHNAPNAFALLNQDPTTAVMSVGALPDAGSPEDFYVVDVGGGSTLGSTTLFPSDDAIASAVAVMPDDSYALVADDGFFAGSRIGVAALPSSGPVAVDVLSTPNPADVVASPYGNSALVLNSDGQDALTRLSFDPANTAHPFAIAGPISYVAPHPQLPAEAVVLQRGSLRGRVLIGELSGVRQVQFQPDGGITDLSLFSTGPDLIDIVGALGVQP